MPRFLTPNSEALNDTIRPKRKVFRNMVKTFVDEKFPNLGTTEEIEKVYDSLSSKLTELYTTLADVVNLIVFAPNRAQLRGIASGRAINEYFSSILKATNALDLMMNKYKTLNLLIPEQIDNLQALVSSITQKYAELKSAPSLTGENTIQSSLFDNSLASISGLDLVLQKLQGLLGSYKQVPAGSSLATAISAIPIPAPTAYGVRGAGLYGGAIIPEYNKSSHPFSQTSDGYTINTVNYSCPARFY
jgi:hypothetical protein